MQKIGLYFGSFNPIHHGHLIIAMHMINESLVEQVWFVVSPQNPLKKSNSLLNEYQRLYMVQLSIEGESRLRASDIEFRLPRPSYTIDTLTYLKEKYPEKDFSIILGSDSYLNLDKWKNYEVLKRDFSFLIYQRPGFIIEKDLLPIHHTLTMAPMLDLSASFIRNALKQGKNIKYLVPDLVKEEIEKNNYYNN